MGARSGRVQLPNMLTRKELDSLHPSRKGFRDVPRAPISVVLHRPSIPNNLGACARICDAVLASHLYICGPNPGWATGRRRKDPEWGVTDKDAHHWVPHSFLPDTVDLLRIRKMAGDHITALERTRDSIPYDRFPYRAPLTIVVGSEEGGLPPEVMARCDGAVHVPMRGAVRYLNMATALAVVLYKGLEVCPELRAA